MPRTPTPRVPRRARNAPAPRASGADRSLGSLRREASRTPECTLARVPPPPPLRSITARSGSQTGAMRKGGSGAGRRAERASRAGPAGPGFRAPLDDARGGPVRWGKGAHVPTLRPGLRLPRRPRGGFARSSGAPPPGVGVRPARLGAALPCAARQPSPRPSLTLPEDPRVQRPPTVPSPKMPLAPLHLPGRGAARPRHTHRPGPAGLRPHSAPGPDPRTCCFPRRPLSCWA